MEDKLSNYLQNVNEWLRFAEAKNGVLIALNSGLIYAFDSTLRNWLITENTCLFAKFFYYEFIVLMVLSIVALLLSFLPQTSNNIFWFSTSEKNQNDNLLYFGDIQKYSPTELLIKLNENNTKDFSGSERYYANQIVINSKITYRKLSYFKFAVLLTISSVATIFGGIIIYLIFTPNN